MPPHSHLPFCHNKIDPARMSRRKAVNCPFTKVRMVGRNRINPIKKGEAKLPAVEFVFCLEENVYGNKDHPHRKGNPGNVGSFQGKQGKGDKEQ